MIPFSRHPSVLSLLLTAAAANAAPILYDVTPSTSAGGAAVQLAGVDLGDVARLDFHADGSGISTPFALAGETLIDAVTPLSLGTSSPWGIAAYDGNDIALLLSDRVQEIEGYVGGGAGVQFTIVRSGGSYVAGSGNGFTVVESGGAYSSWFSGNQVVYVKNGGYFSGFGEGGNNTLYYEAGADLNLFDLGGGGNRFIQVETISVHVLGDPFTIKQPVAAVPEPGTLALFLLGIAGVIGRRSWKAGNQRLPGNRG